MVFEHADIIVSHCDLIIHVDQKDIIDARMLKIVQCGANIAAHLLQIVKSNYIFDPCIHREVVECLADIRCVRLIMIRDSFISTCQFAYEAHQARKINIAAPNQTMFC